MRGTKRLFTVVSAVICSMSMSATYVHAANYYFDKSSDEYIQRMGGYTEIDDSGLWKSLEWRDNPDPKPYRIYSNQAGNSFIYEEDTSKMFSFTVTNTADINEFNTTVQTILDQFDSSYEVSKTFDEDSHWTYTVIDNNLNPDTLRNAMDICIELKNQGAIIDFTYYGNISSPIYVECPYLLSYYVDFCDKEKLTEYATSHNLGSVIEVDKDNVDFWGKDSWVNAYCIIPDTDLTVEEHFAAAKQVYDDLGYMNVYISPSTENSSKFADILDLYNAKYGDVNSDGAVNAVDASMMLSYYADVQTGGAEKYTGAETMSMTLFGDYNNDGTVNATDASCVLNVYADSQTT